MSQQEFRVDLSGHTAFVTGASAGLGRSYAKTLARNGAKVVAAARRLPQLEDLVKEIEAEGGTAAACELDICDAAAITRAIEDAQNRFGLVNILVNNAAVTDMNFATKLSLERIDAVIDTNYRAPLLLSVEVARRLIAAGAPGRIVNVSSVGAFTAGPRSAASVYSGAKAGLNRLSQCLALEWARYGINVNAICPGMFWSEMTDRMLSREADAIVQNFPRKRFQENEDFDSTLLYLVSPASHGVTGAVIVVDDGQMTR